MSGIPSRFKHIYGANCADEECDEVGVDVYVNCCWVRRFGWLLGGVLGRARWGRRRKSGGKGGRKGRVSRGWSVFRIFSRFCLDILIPPCLNERSVAFLVSWLLKSSYAWYLSGLGCVQSGSGQQPEHSKSLRIICPNSCYSVCLSRRQGVELIRWRWAVDVSAFREHMWKVWVHGR